MKIQTKSNSKLSKVLKAILAGISVIVILCVVSLILSNTIIVCSTRENIYNVNEASSIKEKHSFDCIIVFGCEVLPDKSPSIMLGDRLACAVSLYFEGVSDKILISGDKSDANYDEVTCMKNYLLEHSIPQDSIIADYEGFSTIETALRAKTVFNIDSACLVTQEYHLYRALYLCQQFGIDCVGVCAQGHEFVAQPYFNLREVAARLKDFVYCEFI